MSAIAQFRPQDDDPIGSTLLTAVMESSSESLAIVESGRIVQANNAFSRAFGYQQAQEVEGRMLAGLIPESPFLFSGRSTGGEDERNRPSMHECGGVHKDGTALRISMALSVLHTPQRDLVVINLPHRSSMAESEQWLNAQKLETMGRLVAGVAHDFNNLLTGILLYCDLLNARMEQGNPLRGYVEEIRKAGGQSAGLIQQLLTVSRPQAAELRAISWSEIVFGMWNFFERMLGENIALTAQFDPDAGLVRMDASRMRQIVLNLLLNSRDAMPDGGSIMLTLRDSAEEHYHGYVEFVVIDSGCGMDAGTRSRLFEPFFSTKKPGQGNGLGLATVQRIVREAGGVVRVASEPGKGTAISVCLPRTRATSSAEISAIPSTEAKAR